MLPLKDLRCAQEQALSSAGDAQGFFGWGESAGRYKCRRRVTTEFEGGGRPIAPRSIFPLCAYITSHSRVL